MRTPAEQHVLSSSTGRSRSDWMVLACALLVIGGFVLRLVLAWYSIGTNDAGAWHKFAQVIDERGLRGAYVRFPSLNHPPLPAQWSAAALRASHVTGTSFEFIFKLPAILSDAASCALLALIWRRRGTTRAAWLVAVAMALNLCAILVSAYHCNTDSIYALFALLACFFADRRRMFLAGLALGAAIHVKLIPVLLILPLLSLCRDRRDALRFVAALSLGAVPFLVMFIVAGEAFVRNVVLYNPQANRWGIAFPLYEMYQHESTRRFALDAMRFYFENGRWFILAAVALLSLFSWTRRAWNAYELGAMTLAMFLVLTPGFGLQYTAILAPLLLAVSLRIGTLWGVVAGAFLLVVYAQNWTGTLPLYSFFDGPVPLAGALVGALTWLLLIVFSVTRLTRGKLMLEV